MPNRAWLYLRLGRSQVPEGEPMLLAAQRQRCVAHCAQQGLIVVGESADSGHFGPRQRRPGLEQALAVAPTHPRL